MDRKDHIIAALTQLNDDLRAKIVNLYADMALKSEEKEAEIVALKKQANGKDELVRE